MGGQRLDLSAKMTPPGDAGLVRRRLLDLFEQRFGFVVAPAGHGKSTLLAQLARQFDGDIAWYRIDAEDRDPQRLLERLGGLLTKLFALEPGDRRAAGRPAATALAERFEAALTESVDMPRACLPALLVFDDFHVIAGTESERRLIRLLSMTPPPVRVVLSARRAGGLDVEALRLRNDVQVLDADDLRFRSWEVEALFRDVYRQPLPPEDAAVLTRRTQGWAAGLAMFHLLTEGRPPAQRHQALADLARGSRLVRSYLVREVLSDLPGTLRDFLRRTSALGVLTGELCDQLLGATGSQQVLEELEQRRLFTTTQDDGRRFAYHQVLLDHLELELTEELGPAARAWYARAARLLLAAGEVPAAFRAYARAEDWRAVEGLLRDRGAEVVAGPLASIENLLPVAIHAQDPWLMLARARSLVERGAFADAVATFKLARTAAEDVALAERCLEEERAAAIWLPDAEAVALGWAGVVRAASQRSPGRVKATALAVPGAQGRLAAAVVHLLAGDLAAAAALAAEGADHPDADFDVVVMAGCVGRVVALLEPARGEAGRGPDERDVQSLLLEAEACNRTWLLRVARALLDGDAGQPTAAGLDADPWGGALVALAVGMTRRSGASLRDAAARFSGVGAPVPAQWATCLSEALAVAEQRASSGKAPSRGNHWSGPAGQRARALGLRDVLPLADRWAGATDGAPRAPAAGARSPAPDLAAPAEPALRLRLLGGLEISVHGQVVDLRAVRPRARSTLRLLALRAGDLVHRDTLIGQLWPDHPEEPALRGLQVAISSLRRLLKAAEPAAGWAVAEQDLLVRVGPNYGLRLPPGCRTDVQEFESHVAAARSARRSGDRVGDRAHLEAALALFRGELLPEEGAAEWVLQDRELLRLAAAGAAESLARSLAESGRRTEAVDAARAALRLDPYQDNVWQLLVELHTLQGNRTAAETARREHEHLLAELGLSRGGR